MKIIGIALGQLTRCKLCQVLMVYGVSSPEAIRAFNAMRESNGYRGKPVFGASWVQLLKDHEADHLRRDEVLPEEWTVRALSQEFKDSLEPRKPVSLEELAIAKFQLLAGKGKQANGHREPQPIKKLDLTPFKGL